MEYSDRIFDKSCGSLLRELQVIWDEVGESDGERDKVLLDLEQECLEVYRRKVDGARQLRASLLNSLSDAQSELSSLISILDEDPSLFGQSEKQCGTLKQQLASVQPRLNEMRQKKEQRIKQFADIKAQIQRIQSEISESGIQSAEPDLDFTTDEPDLSLTRLDDYHEHLQSLQSEKMERLRKVLDSISAIHELCAVLGIDFFKVIREVNPSLDDSTTAGQPKSISNDTIQRLAGTINSLHREKKNRIQKLQHLGNSLIELWALMETPDEERKPFCHITDIIASDENDVASPRALAVDNIEQAEVEVERLDQLKASKMKELVRKKHSELEEIYRRAHTEPDPKTSLEQLLAIIDSGVFDPSELLGSVDGLMAKAKEEAFARKEILDKVDKWMAACEEETWLHDYNTDENRYNASRGAHINLKRAEKARIAVNKIPAMVDMLVAKTKSWEEEKGRGTPFLYDGVLLLDMLYKYTLLRKEKEEEKRHLRDHKRMQEQLMSEKEALFGSRQSPTNKPTSVKKGLGSLRSSTNSTNSSMNCGPNRPTSANSASTNRRLSLQQQQKHQQHHRGAELLTPRVNGTTPLHAKGMKDSKREKMRVATPLINYVALAKEDNSPTFASLPPSHIGLEALSPITTTTTTVVAATTTTGSTNRLGPYG